MPAVISVYQHEQHLQDVLPVVATLPLLPRNTFTCLGSTRRYHGNVLFILCILLGLSLGVAVGVSATSCGHPMATTVGHSMVTSTGDLKIFIHEMFVVFPLMVTCVDFPNGNFLFLFCFSVGSFTGGCHRGVHRWWPLGCLRRVISLRYFPQRIA